MGINPYRNLLVVKRIVLKEINGLAQRGIGMYT
jgi:hypothetical protein